MQLSNMWRLVRVGVVSGYIALQGCSGGGLEPVGAGGGGSEVAVEDGAPYTGRVYHYPFHDAAPDPDNAPAETYEYYVYVPSRHSNAAAWPLVVFLHGCGYTADKALRGHGINVIADEEDFLVMYPDNLGGCWRATSNTEGSVTRGGGGDADLIAEMTQDTIRNYNVDPERVYIIGGSAGGFQSAATAAAWPDIYAASGVVASGGVGMTLDCIVAPDAAVPLLYSPTAIERMGEYARIIPFFSLGGTEDFLGEQVGTGCTRKAFIAAMATNNILTGGGQTGDGGRFSLDPSSTVQGQAPEGYAWTKEVWRDTAGCQIGERWIINGMGHTYPGPRRDGEEWADFNDPKGPDTGRAFWEFFRRYRKSDTGNECAESQ